MSTDDDTPAWPFDAPGDDGTTASNVAEYSVSEISFALKRTVEDTFGHVRVRGELGRVSRPASGHVYLDLKDDKAVLNGVIWKGVAGRLKIQPEQGLEVIVTGKITTFPGQSKYQIIIDTMEPAGVGALMALLEERRKKLAAEGLFDEARKKPLPFLPEVIGVVTSPTGAVIRDILHRLADRFPRRVLVWPVRVQGETSGDEVAAAIRGFNNFEPGGELPRPDLLIVARGGGSLEDLWGFNEEAVVRAAAESAIPLVSAVGHETDWTLIDYAADHRAPTPTGAAERAVPVRMDLLAQMDDLSARLRRGVRRGLSERVQSLRAASRGLPRLEDALALPRQRLDGASQRLGRGLLACAGVHRARLERLSALHSPAGIRRVVSEKRERLEGRIGARAAIAMRTGFERRRQVLDGHGKLLVALGYQGVLARGFALVRDKASANPLRAAAATSAGEAIEIQFHDGAVDAVVGEKGAGPAKRTKPKQPAKPKSGDKNQGSLF
ncbi:MAG: exodeoxyribonuclease VII large subunit [Hyphomicrobiales bacterium]